MPQSRTAIIERKTRETLVRVKLNLDGEGTSETNTGIGFLDHMLELLARHANIDLTIKASGDLHIDGHHTTEDIAIVLGQAIKEALGNKAGIQRYGNFFLPMDEALTRVVIDLSNRPFLVWKTAFPAPKVGDMDTELFREFFQAFASAAGATLHIETLYGVNSHHIAESCFKGLGRALRQSVSIDPDLGGRVPSTKGSL